MFSLKILSKILSQFHLKNVNFKLFQRKTVICRLHLDGLVGVLFQDALTAFFMQHGTSCAALLAGAAPIMALFQNISLMLLKMSTMLLTFAHIFKFSLNKIQIFHG